MSAVSTSTYLRTHTAAFVSDKLRNLLKILIQYHSLNPTALVDSWTNWVDRAARAWLETDDLDSIVIEFYKPGTTIALARWDFPIRYDGNGVDEMWIDRQFLQDSFAKSTAPPAGCIYRVLLVPRRGARELSGMQDASFFSLNGLAPRDVGTVIATPDIMASARYYR